MVIVPSQVLANITHAMERIDLDINTEISIEEDVVSVEELMGLIQSMGMGPTLMVHILNTAMRIMSARYPEELVRRPFPPQYDLRAILPVELDDEQHEVAKTIFNPRSVSDVDLTESDVRSDLETLDVPGQMQVFVTLIFMYGTKVGAMKNRTGIE